jgi:hypothetical protein
MEIDKKTEKGSTRQKIDREKNLIGKEEKTRKTQTETKRILDGFMKETTPLAEEPRRSRDSTG